MATLSPPARHQLSAASDERLVSRAREGDDAAFEVIVERYAPLLLRRTRRIAGDEAQDAVQRAFINAWNALRGGCDVRELRPWLCTIAHRSALQTLRERGDLAAELPDSLASHSSPVDQFEQSARTRTILSAIARLPASEQEALVSTSLLGLSGRATAHTLGISEGAVRQLVYRARARLKTAAFVPPVAVTRLWGKWGHGHGARRVAGLGDGAARNVSSPESVGMFVKLGATVAAGLAIGAPAVILNRDGGGDDHPRSHPAHADSSSERSLASASAHRSVESAGARPRDGSGHVARRPGSPLGARTGSDIARAATPGAGPDGSTGSAVAAHDTSQPAPVQARDGGPPVALGKGADPAPAPVGQIVSEVKSGAGQAPPVVHKALTSVGEVVQGVQTVAEEAHSTLTSTGEAVVAGVKEVLPAPSKVLQGVAPIVHLR